MFTFAGLTRRKIVIFDDNMANEFVNTEKPKGLHKTRIDLDFPQTTSTNTTIYRVVQFLMNGPVTELQRDLYRNVELKLTGNGVHGSVTGPCKVDVVLKLSPPSSFQSNGVFEPKDEGMERVFSLSKDETKVVTFENVFGDDFPMDHFWANFSVRGKCNMYMDVELIKPDNSLETL
ncbi:hypothetical protein MACK_002761 [Theileria orientalis]|uniref:Uncharacterized protein n=1 Tax=Theileria orientalis TaxID=68886 RepID=A0A976QVR1_THEOR|nr:hypothetical protein MACK_002761 [Theileria orientalis]